MLDDTLLLALLPALLVLIGCPLLLGWRWPGMGLLGRSGRGGLRVHLGGVVARLDWGVWGSLSSNIN